MPRHRHEAITTANNRRPRKMQRPTGPDGRPLPVAAYFGRNTFSDVVMADKLPKPVYRRVRAVIDGQATMAHTDADAVAHAVKEWALENGCSHFTHWFQPMTGNTAEKHDAFLTFDREGNALERFSGGALIQSEPDASSFPSGGMRSTFEARGYTAWDPSSPIFIMEGTNGNTLCIPSVFVSYTGEALDKKTPLLRSMEAIETAAGDLLEALGQTRLRVVPTLGCEQEYFLIDRAYWAHRPDLAIGGRTVVGAPPPKGQSLDDHYFGSISPRVLAFMAEVESDLYKLGVPAKTRHNEVAPSQYELAPVYRQANVGVDHNQIVMEVLRRVAVRHDFKVLMHEKPFAGINGSGKHANWSIEAGGENLLEPGAEPTDNLRFLAMLSSVLLGVHRYSTLLRGSVATYGNDFRLGANEAPPAIISVFLGDLLTRICDALASGDDLPANPQQAMLELGVSSLPHVAKDNTDRNRTSPMAFTGNKFEFRAVGSDQSPAWPCTVLNTLVAEGMSQITDWISEEGGGATGAFKAIRRAIKESTPVRFEGNGYSEEWVVEAARRGLPNLAKTPHALAHMLDPHNVEVFRKHGVLSPAELESRYNILTEQYETAVAIEADCLRIAVDEMILPAALSERGDLGRDLASIIGLMKDAGLDVDVAADKQRLALLSKHIGELRSARVKMDEVLESVHHEASPALAMAEQVLPVFDRLRAAADALEGHLSDLRWPLPKYREMLFLV